MRKRRNKSWTKSSMCTEEGRTFLPFLDICFNGKVRLISVDAAVRIVTEMMVQFSVVFCVFWQVKYALAPVMSSCMEFVTWAKCWSLKFICVNLTYVLSGFWHCNCLCAVGEVERYKVEIRVEIKHSRNKLSSWAIKIVTIVVKSDTYLQVVRKRDAEEDAVSIFQYLIYYIKYSFVCFYS